MRSMLFDFQTDTQLYYSRMIKLFVFQQMNLCREFVELAHAYSAEPDL